MLIIFDFAGFTINDIDYLNFCLIINLFKSYKVQMHRQKIVFNRLLHMHPSYNKSSARCVNKLLKSQKLVIS